MQKPTTTLFLRWPNFQTMIVVGLCLSKAAQGARRSRITNECIVLGWFVGCQKWPLGFFGMLRMWGPDSREFNSEGCKWLLLARKFNLERSFLACTCIVAAPNCLSFIKIHIFCTNFMACFCWGINFLAVWGNTSCLNMVFELYGIWWI